MSASGVIEGACRHFVKNRCELSGMRWGRSGVENLLRLRAVAENNDWDVITISANANVICACIIHLTPNNRCWNSKLWKSTLLKQHGLLLLIALTPPSHVAATQTVTTTFHLPLEGIQLK